jgi:hypothetical protein
VLLQEAAQNLFQLRQTDFQVRSLLVDVLIDCVDDFLDVPLLLLQDVEPEHGEDKPGCSLAILVVS